MLREEALRRALQFARDRRARDLEDVQERSRALRRRLRELSDRGLALGSVHGRFAPEVPAEGPGAEAPAAGPPAHVPPIVTSLAASVPAITPAPLAPHPEESHDKLLVALAARLPDGFTVSQMKAIMEELDGRVHSYDAAWALANRLERGKALEIAGSRPGPAGPIRVFRVPRPHLAAPEAR